MVNTPAAKLPLTPAGKPVTVAPVTPFVVVYVILVIAVFRHTVCASVPAAELSAIVAFELTVITPASEGEPQLPEPVVVTV